MNIALCKHFLDKGLADLFGLSLIPESTKSKHHPIKARRCSTCTNHGSHMVRVII
jgi:hypothetical protein